jgi:allantoin racemase
MIDESPYMMNESVRKQLLLINPNTTEVVTQRLLQVLTTQLPDLVHLDAVTASFGAKYIACEASHAVASHATLDAWAQYLVEHPAPDGVLIACFGDPGLFALRQSSACPVTGLAEASFIEAAAYGEFAIVTGGQRWRPMLTRLAQNLGYDAHLRHIEILTPTGAQLLADPIMALESLAKACQTAEKAGAKAIIIGGAGLAGYAAQLQSRCDVSLIDSALAGMRVLLEGKITASSADDNGFEAQWQTISAPMKALERS